MSFIGRLARHTSIYTIGEVLVIAAGFISFPVFTRLLSTEEYGLMSLATVIITLLEAVSSLGLRHASQRYYDHYAASKKGGEFYATILFSSVGGGAAGTAALLLFAWMAIFWWPQEKQLWIVLAMASVLVVTRVIFQAISGIYRVEQRPALYVSTTLATKYLAMIGAVLLVVFSGWGLHGYYLGLGGGEIAVMLAAMWMFARRTGVRVRKTSPAMLKQMRAYGYPLVIAGFSATLLEIGDRYLIKFFLGNSAVAVYTVAYSLCLYAGEGLKTSFQFALVPMIMHEWEKGDKQAVARQVGEAIRLFSFVSIPVFIGLAALADEIIIFAASARYADSAPLILPIAMGLMVHGVFSPVMIGLYLYEKTFTVALFMFGAMATNLLLNILLIPPFHLHGAAIATILSYIVLLAAGGGYSQRIFKVELPWRTIVNLALAASLMGLLIVVVKKSSVFLALPVGVAGYLALVWTLDGQLRSIMNRAVWAMREKYKELGAPRS